MRMLYFTIIFSAIVLGACDTRQLKNYGVPPGLSISNRTPIDYQTVKSYSLAYCVKCHRDHEHPNLANYESVKEHIDDVIVEVTTDEMPPPEETGFDSLTACQKEVLTAWVQRGMPESDGLPLGTPNSCF